MKIETEFEITSFTATGMENAPFKITLRDRVGVDSFVTFDKDTFAQLGDTIQIVSHELVGRVLSCFITVDANQARTHEHRCRNGSKNNYILGFWSLSKTDSIRPMRFAIPPTNHEEVSRTLKLSSWDGGDGIHPTTLPCPLFELSIDLTEEEYAECKDLPPESNFRASFSIFNQ